MDDWEQFFVDKSRRRFEQERAEKRGQRIRLLITIVGICVIVAAAVLGLAILASH